jgi:hypothetical protein
VRGIGLRLQRAAPTVDPSSIATAVAATLTAAAPPPASSGTVNGTTCYPADRILPMTAYFQNTADNSLTALAIAEDQGSYRLQLAPGPILPTPGRYSIKSPVPTLGLSPAD